MELNVITINLMQWVLSYPGFATNVLLFSTFHLKIFLDSLKNISSHAWSWLVVQTYPRFATDLPQSSTFFKKIFGDKNISNYHSVRFSFIWHSAGAGVTCYTWTQKALRGQNLCSSGIIESLLSSQLGSSQLSINVWRRRR